MNSQKIYSLIHICIRFQSILFVAISVCQDDSYDDDDVTQTDIYRVTSQDVGVLTWLQRKIEEVLVDVEQQNTKTYTF